jgi:hypothetical protein
MAAGTRGKGSLYIALREPVSDFGLTLDPTRIIVPKSRCTCHTLYEASQQLQGRIVVLLGDVYYTPEALHSILECNRSFCVFTDGQDIFALTLFRGDPMIGHAKEISDMMSPPNHGRLWEAYRRRVGDKGTGIPPLPKYLTHFVEDRTQDFDTQEEYDNFLKGISKNRFQAKSVRVRQPSGDGETPRVLEVRKVSRHRDYARRGRTRLNVETTQ